MLEYELSLIKMYFSWQLRWLNTVFKKMENSRFRCVFLDNYYLLINKKCLTYITKKSKEFEFLHKSYATVVAMATMTFQDGGYFGFKVI
jgi:tellurite resistance protein TehA-like permease